MQKNFCSDLCLGYHIYSFHFNEKILKQSNDKFILNKNKNLDIFNNNNSEKTDGISSLFLTKGSMTIGKVIYDKTYSLKNFRPVIENGKEKVIGTGAYGKVFLAINKIDNKFYAIKHMKKKSLYKALKSLKGIHNEIDIQSRINHSNIVKLLYVKETNVAFDLVMEYSKYGNLYFYIKRNNYLSEEKSFKYFIQVVNAIYFLHKNDLIHRDIKPENILLFDKDIVKLCDFGWCTKLDGGQRITFCGTVEYMSPEMVNKEEYSKEIDIWSLGILLYEMVHGYSPFKPDKPKFNAYDVISNIKIQDLKFNSEISKECKELIIHLLDRDISKRYKIEDILKSKFVIFYENKINKNHSNKSNKNNNIIKEINNNKNNIENNNIIEEEIVENKKENEKQIKNNININTVIRRKEHLIVEKEIQKSKCKVKNNTARNFYSNPFNNIKEKKIIENKIKNKYSSNCKVKNGV